MQQSLSTTWQALHKELVDFVFAKVKDRPTAEDIVQEVFIKVHEKVAQLKQAEKITAWIYQITRNAVADHFRSAARGSHIVIQWDSTSHEFNECVAHCLTLLMAELPEKYRLPLHLTEIEKLSQLEVAERLGITHSGARSRVQRARKLLKAKLEELYIIKTDSYGNVIVCEDREDCCCQTKK